MEYVEGVALSSYCSERKMSIRDRLQLFRTFCAAVTYAHQHLVIHRDLKPSNILATTVGEPKLLDFGIAKLLHAQEHSLTIPELGAMTPEYASPEQIRGRTVTTASYVYSRVIFYKLLTGRSPYQLKTHEPAELERAITEAEPAKPSTVSRERSPESLASQTRLTSREARALRGHLDNIALMAMRKEPARRLGRRIPGGHRAPSRRSAVHAQADTLRYRGAEFVGRHRLGVAGNPYSANLGDTNDALTSYRKALALRTALPDSEKSIDLQTELGRSYRGLGDILEQKGDVAGCIANYQRSLGIFVQLAAQHPADFAVRDELARTYDPMGDGLGRTNRSVERRDCHGKLLAIRESLLSSHPRDRKQRRGSALALMKKAMATDGHDSTAAENARRGAQMLEAFAADDPQDARARREIGWAYFSLGEVLLAAGDHAGTLEARQKALILRQATSAEDSRNAQATFDLAVARADLAEALTLNGRADEALGMLRILSSFCNNSPPLIPEMPFIFAIWPYATKSSEKRIPC